MYLYCNHLINKLISCLFSVLVLRVQFSSKTFLGKESSLTVNMNVVILGGVPESDNVTITFTFNSITATG